MDREREHAGLPDEAGASAPWRTWWRLGVVVVLVVGAVALCHRIGAPFTGWHEWNSAWYSYFARNHLRYGFAYTAGLCTHGHTEEAPEEASRYLSHPPLIAIWVAVPMAVFGDHEWACRLVPIVCTLGSALLVMVMARRLAPRDPPELGAVLSVLAGFCYLVLPITAYFGRMIDHVPVAQFFCLLMLHGYAQWCGLYGECRRGLGAAWYVVGCVCGIGTAWAAAIMAGLIWWWHVVRMRRGGGGWGMLAVLTLVPATALSAVVVQILWALGWDASLFWPLLATRSFGARPEMPQPVLEWLRILGAYWRMNYTLFGAAAVAVYAVGALVCAAMRGSGPVRRLFRARGLRTVFGLAAVQGLIFVVAFKNQSWIHEYWQYFMGPAVAFCMGAVACAVYLALRRVHVILGVAAALVLVIAPLPRYTEGWRDSFWANWREYHARRHIPDEYVEVFELLNDPEAGIEPFAPVMTFRNFEPYEDRFGEYVHRYMQPQIAYYARRPLIFEQRLSRVLANEEGAAAYVLEMNVPESARARVEAMAAELERRFETRQVGGQLIVFLRRPMVGGAPTSQAPATSPGSGALPGSGTSMCAPQCGQSCTSPRWA